MAQEVHWQPDTCGCVVKLVWDDAQPGADPVPVMVSACAAHKGKGGADVLAENRRKNMAVDLVARALGVAPTEVAWEWGPKRTLVLRLPPGKTLPPALASSLSALGAQVVTPGA